MYVDKACVQIDGVRVVRSVVLIVNRYTRTHKTHGGRNAARQAPDSVACASRTSDMVVKDNDQGAGTALGLKPRHASVL